MAEEGGGNEGVGGGETTDVSQLDGFDQEMADLATSMGDGDIYLQSVASSNGVDYDGNRDGGNSIGDNNNDHMDNQGDQNDVESQNEVGNKEVISKKGDGEVGGEDEGENEEGKKPWDVTPDRLEILDSDDFKTMLESHGKTEDEFLKEIVESSSHTLKIRGREKSVSYDKLIADAQMAGASLQKSQRMNVAIADGRMVATIKAGGDAGKIALKALLNDVGSIYEADDISDFVDDLSEVEGEYDSKRAIEEASVARDVETYFSDVIDNDNYKDNMDIIRSEVDGWLPKEMAEDIDKNFSSLREFYDIVDSPAYPEIREMMEDRLTALPDSVSSNIRSNAGYFSEMFDDTISVYAKLHGGTAPSGSNEQVVTDNSQIPSNSKTFSPPRNTSGKRSAGKGTDKDAVPNFLEMSSAELEKYLLQNYT